MTKLLKDLETLPLFKIADKVWCLGECRSFYLKWFKVLGESNTWAVHFGQKKTFDRWANSTNFEVRMQYESGTYRNDIVLAHLWMEKVCRSKLFDFNRYIYTIKAPFNGVENK